MMTLTTRDVLLIDVPTLLKIVLNKKEIEYSFLVKLKNRAANNTDPTTAGKTWNFCFAEFNQTNKKSEYSVNNSHK